MKKREVTNKRRVKFYFVIILITISIIIFLISLFAIMFSNLFLSPDKIQDFSNEDYLASTKPLTGSMTVSDNPSQNLIDSTLILYNENALESREIAEYYATKRGISFSQICPIQVPIGMYAYERHLYGARKTIIENCLCNIIPTQNKPSPCNVDNIDEITKVSPITHLVFIRGIPARVIVFEGTTGIETGSDYEPSFDYFLSFLIYNKEVDFNRPKLEFSYWGRLDDLDDQQTNESTGGYIRSVNPIIDKIAAYGRIDELTKERAKALIDRTINAEQQGISGNFYTNFNKMILYKDDYPYNPAKEFLIDLRASRNSECYSYLTDKTKSWSDIGCNIGFTTDKIPGEEDAEIIDVINPTFFLGTALADTHSAFDGFNNMLNWKKEKNCIALCKDFSTTTERELCKQNSLDYFKEINTECVGTRSLIGWQLRSFPVKYFGFYPKSWSSFLNEKVEKIPPIILTGDSFKNEKFTDNNYLHFGSLDQKQTPECLLEDGTKEKCFELTALWLRKDISYNIPVGTTKNVVFKIRYKIPEENLGKTIKLLTYVRFPSGSILHIRTDTFTLTKSHEWITKELSFPISNNYNSAINGFLIIIQSEFQSERNLRNWIEIDGIEFQVEGTDLINNDEGSFSASPYNWVTAGDWASNVIGRMGGIAWWGSASHYSLGGFSFFDPKNFVGSFFSGRTLGESLLYTGGGHAGNIYGDPLYRPSGVKIFMENGLQEINSKEYIFSKEQLETNGKLYTTAFNGLDGNSKWNLNLCYSDSIDNCQEWTKLKEGDGIVYERDIGYKPSDFVTDITKEQKFILKLKTWREGDEKSILENHAYFHYVPGSFCEKLACKKFSHFDIDLSCKYTPFVGGIDKDYCENGIYYGKTFENRNFFCADNKYQTYEVEKGKCIECYSDSDCDDGNNINGKEFCDVYDDHILGNVIRTGLCYKFNSEWSREISNCEQLQMINRNLDEDYILVNDIDCSESVNWFNGKGFQPIGPVFYGTLDGQGYTIKNLKIYNQNGNAGLFQDGGKLKNLRVVDSEIIGKGINEFANVG